MMGIGEVGVRKQRSGREVKRLVREFETSGLRRSGFSLHSRSVPVALRVAHIDPFSSILQYSVNVLS
jgi:hypothetical protein